MVRRGWLTAKGRPQGRGAERGRDDFVAVTWPEAARLVAGEIARVSRDHGNAAIFGGSYGWASAGRFHHAQSQLKRFLNLCGGFTSSVNTYSYGAAAVLLPHVIGREYQGATDTAPSWDQIAAHARLLTLSAASASPMRRWKRAAPGSIAPRRRWQTWRAPAAGLSSSPTHGRGRAGPARHVEHIPLRPGTDAAVLIAMAQVLLAEGRTDTAALARLTRGMRPSPPIWRATRTACRRPGMGGGHLRRASRHHPGTRPRLCSDAGAGEPLLVIAALAPWGAALLGSDCPCRHGGTGGAAGMRICLRTHRRLLRRPADPPAEGGRRVPQGRNPVSSFIPSPASPSCWRTPAARSTMTGRGSPSRTSASSIGGRQSLPTIRNSTGLPPPSGRPETVIVHESYVDRAPPDTPTSCCRRACPSSATTSPPPRGTTG